jgi:hypothetical protein
MRLRNACWEGSHPIHVMGRPAPGGPEQGPEQREGGRQARRVVPLAPVAARARRLRGLASDQTDGHGQHTERHEDAGRSGVGAQL